MKTVDFTQHLLSIQTELFRFVTIALNRYHA